MAWDVWYERSLRWDPPAPTSADLSAWWEHLGTLSVPTRLVIGHAVHRALQNQPLTWPTAVRRVDTLVAPDVPHSGLNGWTRPPPSWGWLWRAPLSPGLPPPRPSDWPDAPSFKAELIAMPHEAWPHPGTWWLHWAADPVRQTVPLELWLDERAGMDEGTLIAWDRWQQLVARLATGTGWPVKPWAQDADEEDDPRWDPDHHAQWTPEGLAPDVPVWCASPTPGLQTAPCGRCAAQTHCPGPHQPQRWATAAGICSQGRSWRLALAGARP